MGWIGAEQARVRGLQLAKTAYGQAILAAVDGEPRPFPYSSGESRVARMAGR